MSYKSDELRNLAILKKSELRNTFFKIPVGENFYSFKISGIGKMTIKLEKFFYYSEIIKAVQDGVDDGLEYLIEQIIIDPNKNKKPALDSSAELRERASANKNALKQMHINPIIGIKEYEFRIAGIGGKSIKIEFYMNYEDMASVLNEGHEASLEFILKEILVDNEVDYSIFEDLEELDEINADDDNADEDISINIEKLPEGECVELISKLEGLQKLTFDAIDSIDSDVFTVDDVLEQDLIKSYAVQGKSFVKIISKNIGELINLGLVRDEDGKYYKLW